MPFKTYSKFFEVISQSHDRGFAHFTVKPHLLLLAANQLKGLYHTKSHAWKIWTTSLHHKLNGLWRNPMPEAVYLKENWPRISFHQDNVKSSFNHPMPEVVYLKKTGPESHSISTMSRVHSSNHSTCNRTFFI